MEAVVYLNGERVDYADARVSVEDRGFQFGDGLYEVVRVYGGRFFYLNRHLKRLQKGAEEIYMELDFGLDRLRDVCKKAVVESGFKDASVYIQVTRGVAPRQHAFPEKSSCTWVVIVRQAKPQPDEFYENGVKVITVPDERWTRCNIKTVQLIANCIAKEKAKRAGAYEAVFHRGGIVTEGSSSNLFIVKDRKLFTHPANNLILHGITRSVVLEIAEKLGFDVVEEAFSLDRLFDADEAFVTGTMTEVMPIVKVDGKMIGDGVPGEMTRDIMREFRKLTETVDE
ncbi:D-amino-acid transaminase [Thermosediminibacter oceani]|uniref:D-alanine aminotransferase n=1 Tax=Thermosediminibacter oceani (strain ATCC BAA-1034 / DSM 16646 / JW/IW-1228P) TaxID=555079 RepID=D9S2I3_THEOJ|nr:D-amino-acid transaminase [Thermosediminibacter oceani]ADL07610.1 D-amino acid aminotransferase [Thermosediminibacter oceani DSM 16646]